MLNVHALFHFLLLLRIWVHCEDHRIFYLYGRLDDVKKTSPLVFPIIYDSKYDLHSGYRRRLLNHSNSNSSENSTDNADMLTSKAKLQSLKSSRLDHFLKKMMPYIVKQNTLRHEMGDVQMHFDFSSSQFRKDGSFFLTLTMNMDHLYRGTWTTTDFIYFKKRDVVFFM